MTNLHQIANLRAKRLARIKIKNKLYSGRARCAKFRVGISIDAQWRQMMGHFYDLLFWNEGMP